jgi:hypothetical protein
VKRETVFENQAGTSQIRSCDHLSV